MRGFERNCFEEQDGKISKCGLTEYSTHINYYGNIYNKEGGSGVVGKVAGVVSVPVPGSASSVQTGPAEKTSAALDREPLASSPLALPLPLHRHPQMQ